MKKPVPPLASTDTVVPSSAELLRDQAVLTSLPPLQRAQPSALPGHH